MSNGTIRDSPTVVHTCRHCHAVWRDGATRCWLCGAEVQKPTDADGIVLTSAGHAVSPARLGGFSLSSALLMVTAIAVVLGMFSVAPGLGFLGLFVFAPALARTVSKIQRRKQQGQATSIGEKAAVFAASLGIIVVSGVGAVIAFCTTCFGGAFAGGAVLNKGPEDFGAFITGAVAGGLVGLGLGMFIFFRTIRALAPKNTDKPSPLLLIFGIIALIVLAGLWCHLAMSGFAAKF